MLSVNKSQQNSGKILIKKFCFYRAVVVYTAASFFQIIKTIFST